MTLPYSLHGAGLRVFPCRDNKRPAVNKGESWKDYAGRDPSTLRWPSLLVGVPIPDGVVVLDLDTYKGATRESAESVLGCPIPWGAAHIQDTMNGGQHYAFRVSWPVRQATDVGGLQGLDTRTGGKGYICTGEPAYTPHGFGVFAMAHPSCLPELPDGCRRVLEHVAASTEPPSLPVSEGGAVLDALRHLDPGCTRAQWVKIGLALRNQYHDDPSTGFALFDQWSSGAFWPDGAPSNYVPDDMGHQWASFKPTGGVNAASLYYEAIQAGWRPPASFDVSTAFGVDAAPVEAFAQIIEMIHASGTDSRAVADIVASIQSGGFNELQAGLLRGELKSALKSAKLLDKNLTAEIDRQIGGKPPAEYDKNHTANAVTFLDRKYADGRIMRSNETWYAYDGRVWNELKDAEVKHELTAEMLPCKPQSGVVVGTYNILADLTYRAGVDMNRPLDAIVYANGVLCLKSGALMPHGPQYMTTNLLPYEYRPAATAPRWLRFMAETFEGDGERVALLQEWLGYMMSADYRHHKIMLLLGPTRSGKGTIGRITERLVGAKNFSGASLESFDDDDFLDALQSKTVAFSGDTAKHVNRNKVERVIERLKSVSGGDAVEFKRKYKSRLSCVLPTRIMLSSNHIPHLFDDSGALANRLLVLPFDVSFVDREDPNLFDKLVGEIEGIAMWALEGLARLNSAGRFTIPAASRAEMDYIADAFNPMRSFLEAVCTLGGDTVTTAQELYDAYRAWALQSQLGNMLGKNTFTSAFKDATRGKGCRYGVWRDGSTVNRGFVGVAVRAVGVVGQAFAPRFVQ